MGALAERAGYVRWQQDMANDALARGDLRAARVALRCGRSTSSMSPVRKLVTLEAAT